MATKLESHGHLGFHAATLFRQATLPQVKVEAEEIPVSDFRKAQEGDKQIGAPWMSPPCVSPEGLSPHWAVQWLEEIKTSAAFVEDGGECILKSTPLPQLSSGANAEIYLATFEQVASICGWPKAEWVMRLVPLLTGEAQRAYNLLDPIEAKDYAKVKAAILREDLVSTETRRQRFRQFGCHEASGPREACSLLWELGRCWLKPESRTKEQILELLVLEQFVIVLPEEMQRWVQERQPKNCAQAVALAEEFQENARLKAEVLENQAALCMKIEGVTSETMGADILRESLPSQFCPERGAEQEEGQIEYKLSRVSGKELQFPKEMGLNGQRTSSCEKLHTPNWGEKETRTFLSIWGHEHLQKMLQHQSQDEEVYQKIARQMVALGYDRDWEQCRRRAKELCRGYKDARDQNWHTERGRQMWPYFEDLDAILGPPFEACHGDERDGDAGDGSGGDTCFAGYTEADSQSSAELASLEQNTVWAVELKERKGNSQALFQRAANWGEKETRDFLRLWGQKRVQRLLRQQHWNEGIYKEVSVEMAALGYSRDWEQCRQRAKDLRRGYKDIKERKKRSARGRKVWQYFEELETILGPGADPDAHCHPLTTESWKDGFMAEGLAMRRESPLGAQDSDQMDRMSGSSEEMEELPVLCQRAEKWGEKETLDFLGIWGQDHIQSLLHHHHRNEEVYKKIAEDMAALGYERDWEQCRQRAKDLRRGYREVKDHSLCSRRGRQMWQYFEELDGILRRWYEMGSSGHAEEQAGLDGPSGRICTQDSLGHQVSPQTCSDNPVDTSALQLPEPADTSGHAELAGGQTPVQRAAKWGERETRDFLSIWGHGSVQGQLHQQYRNEEVYKQIATQMAALGYDRDWEQCRQRAKDLRRSYRDAKDQNRRYGRGRQVWQYFEELEAILGHWGDKGSGCVERDKGGEDSLSLSEHQTGGSVAPCVSLGLAGPVLLETQLQGAAKRGRVQVAGEVAKLNSCSR